MIYDKVELKFCNLFKYFSYKRKVNKFRSNILNGSPSFDLLWNMADFIKFAEGIFFYDNSLKNTEFGLYSSRNYTNGQNGFRVSTPECRLVIKLFSDHQRVCVEIERIKGEGRKSTLSFTDGDWDDSHNQYDEMLLEQIIKVINSSIIALFDHCYNLR